MTNTMSNPVTRSRSYQQDWSLHSLEVEAELERLDRHAGHEYVPMDIYVNPGTMKEHFQYSSIRARWFRIHKSADR